MCDKISQFKRVWGGEERTIHILMICMINYNYLYDNLLPKKFISLSYD